MISSLRTLRGGPERDQVDRRDDAAERSYVGSLGSADRCFEGLYAAASGMEAQQTAARRDLQRPRKHRHRRLPGRRRRLPRPALLKRRRHGSNGGYRRRRGLPDRWLAASSQGSIQATGRPLDVAIQGPGYLEVRRPDGTIGLTRNGALQLNAQAPADHTDWGCWCSLRSRSRRASPGSSRSRSLRTARSRPRAPDRRQALARRRTGA